MVNVGVMKNAEMGEPRRKTPKISPLPTTIVSPTTPRLELGTPVGRDEQFNRLFAGTTF